MGCVLCCACQHERHAMCFHAVPASMGGTRCVFMLCLPAWAAHDVFSCCACQHGAARDVFSCCACQHGRHTMCFHAVPASIGGTRCQHWRHTMRFHVVPATMGGTRCVFMLCLPA